MSGVDTFQTTMHSKWFLTLTLFVICGYEKGYGADMVLRCPDHFVAKKVNTLTVEINTVAVAAAGCALTPNKVTFRSRRVSDNPNAPSSEICIADYSCQEVGPVLDPPNISERKCGCVNKSRDYLTFEMKFIPDKDLDTAANFSAQVCAFPAKKFTKHTQKSCSLASVGPHTMPGTSKAPVTDEMTNADDDSGCHTVCIVLVVLGVLAVLVGATVAGVCIVRKNRKWGGGFPVPT